MLIVPVFRGFEVPGGPGLDKVVPWIAKALGKVDHVMIQPLALSGFDALVGLAVEVPELIQETKARLLA